MDAVEVVEVGRGLTFLASEHPLVDVLGSPLMLEETMMPQKMKVFFPKNVL